MIGKTQLQSKESEFNYIGVGFSRNNNKIKQRESNRRYLNRLKKENLDLFDNKCAICGSVNNLEFHHKEKSNLGSSRGSYNRYNEVRKYPERFLLVCRECHNIESYGVKKC